MTAKKHILAFEIGTFFTRYVVFEDGRMGIPGTIATPVDSCLLYTSPSPRDRG